MANTTTLKDYLGSLQDQGMSDDDISSHVNDTLNDVTNKQVPTEDLPINQSDLNSVTPSELGVASKNSSLLNQYDNLNHPDTIQDYYKRYGVHPDEMKSSVVKSAMENDHPPTLEDFNNFQQRKFAQDQYEKLFGPKLDQDELKQQLLAKHGDKLNKENSSSPIELEPDPLVAKQTEDAANASKMADFEKNSTYFDDLNLAAHNLRQKAPIPTNMDELFQKYNALKNGTLDKLEPVINSKLGRTIGVVAKPAAEMLEKANPLLMGGLAIKDANDAVNNYRSGLPAAAKNKGIDAALSAGSAINPIIGGLASLAYGAGNRLPYLMGDNMTQTEREEAEEKQANDRKLEDPNKITQPPVQAPDQSPQNPNSLPIANKNPNDVDVMDQINPDEIKNDISNRGPAGKPTPTPSTEDVKSAIIQSAKERGVDPAFALAQGFQESAFKPTAASGKGAVGAMQVTPIAFKDLQQHNPKYKHLDFEDLKDPDNYKEQIDAGLDYMDLLKKRNPNATPDELLRIYNGGSGNKNSPESLDYSDKILNHHLPKFQQLVASNRGPAGTMDEQQDNKELPVEKNVPQSQELSPNEKVLAFLRSGNDVSSLGKSAPLSFGPSSNPQDYSKGMTDQAKLLDMKARYEAAMAPQKEPAIPVEPEATNPTQQLSPTSNTQSIIDNIVQNKNDFKDQYMNAMGAQNKNQLIAGLLRGAQQAATGFAGMSGKVAAKNESDKMLEDLSKTANSPVDQLKSKLAFDQEDPSNPQAENLRKIIAATFEKAGMKSPDLSQLSYNDIVKNSPIFAKIADTAISQNARANLLNTRMDAAQKATQEKTDAKENVRQLGLVKDATNYINSATRSPELQRLHQQQNRINTLGGTLDLPPDFNMANVETDPVALATLKKSLGNKNMLQVKDATMQLAGILGQGKPSDQAMKSLGADNLNSLAAKYQGFAFSSLPPANQQEVLSTIVKIAGNANNVINNQIRQRKEDVGGSLKINTPDALAAWQATAQEHGLRSNPEEIREIHQLMRDRKLSRDDAEDYYDSHLKNGGTQ